MFEELADYRAFELLRSHSARSDYLLTKQARIIAMTCTHAALIRRKLVELGFKYDNMVMEESAQILEVETFIPMMLQVGGCGGVCRDGSGHTRLGGSFFVFSSFSSHRSFYCAGWVPFFVFLFSSTHQRSITRPTSEKMSFQ